MVCKALCRCITGTVNDDTNADDMQWRTAWGCLPHTSKYGWRGLVYNCWFLSATFVGVGLSLAFLVESFLPIYAPVGGVLLLILTTWLMFAGSRMHSKENVYRWSETMGPLLMRINIGYALGVLIMMMRQREGLNEVEGDSLFLWLTVPISAFLFACVLLTVCSDNACTLPYGEWNSDNCWAAFCLCARDQQGVYEEPGKESPRGERTLRIVVDSRADRPPLSLRLDRNQPAQRPPQEAQQQVQPQPTPARFTGAAAAGTGGSDRTRR
jgi:hypothetical protein